MQTLPSMAFNGLVTIPQGGHREMICEWQWSNGTDGITWEWQYEGYSNQVC